MNILFVCTGNTCRSPMAEAIFNNLFSDRAPAKSAGLFAASGSSAAVNTEKVLKENNIHISHQAKQLDHDDVNWADYVFTMTKDHKAMLTGMYPAASDKTFTLKEYVLNSEGNLDIIDPYGRDIEVYRSTYKELRQLIEKLPKLLD